MSDKDAIGRQSLSAALKALQSGFEHGLQYLIGTAAAPNPA
jgi:hypothetical protein